MAKKNVKGLNMEKVAEIRNEVEEVMEVTTIVEKENKSVEEIKEMIEVKEVFGDEMVKEFRLIQAKKEKLNSGIRYAIIQGKKEILDNKFVPGSAIKAIIKNYEVITGGLMSDEQMDILKKLNPTQIYYIEETIKTCLAKIRANNFNKRMKQVTA